MAAPAAPPTAAAKQPSDGPQALTGFGSHVQSEALPGALPWHNSPQRCPYGLYAEQLSGTAFTAPRARNQRSWLYRIRPSVQHSRFVEVEAPGIVGDFSSATVDPNQLRWAPFPLPESRGATFLDGLRTLAGSGDAASRSGLAIHVYGFDADMPGAMYNSDGDMLIVPQQGTLLLQTEMGRLRVEPCEVVVVPRGVKFRVRLEAEGGAEGGAGDGAPAGARGYVLEVFKGHFELPQLGPIGANGLANARDFVYPTADFEDLEGEVTLHNKFMGRLFACTLGHSPFDVVAWHGNYAPFKYDLRRFNCINSVSFDHPDPSIYTVLTCRSDEEGTALADFVIFPPRWMVMEHTFRPPYFHRNAMSEFMGMVYGAYDAKKGFRPGGASLHSAMSAHGPDEATFRAASTADLEPVKFTAGLAFMFETSLMLKLTRFAMETPALEEEYASCWSGLPKVFDGVTREVDAERFRSAPSSG